MRKLCPNFDREDGLDTVLEVPIPEEMFASNKHGNRSWQNIKAWMRPHNERSVTTLFGAKNTEIQLLLGVVGAPLIPLPILCDHQFINRNIKDHPIESSMAKYIVQQYIAAVGGERALNSVDSMYAMGKVKMVASEFCAGEGSLNNNKTLKVKNQKHGGGEMGGFVLWKKRPDLWCLELVVSGCKISAGSDGKVAWRQTPWHHSHASRGPPRPLRRFLQGLDPKSTANLFSNSVCTGEKTINNEDCFVLKLEAEPSSLRARSTSNVEIIRHTLWGYFSQRTGLLVQLEDSHLLRIKASGNDSIFWETTMESSIQDYRTIDGINIAYKGRTSVSLFRFGETSESHSRTRMEEIWAIEEVDFNIKGLSMDCFLPPSDLKKEEEGCDNAAISNSARLPFKIRSASSRISVSKVVAIDDVDDSDGIYDEDEDRE
ncbi:PREDICTED: uncharacterized protein LOC105133646 [Populus euphratica]|uniref:Uncharacterized protein LOC105133646 n=1 Tax=Populus euphratica TaxID=75702 RepID=A0AAJ6XYR4_POPEU|nr:PREDICTED: uncharacterized protein LOC105133646 [Populus euphratica]